MSINVLFKVDVSPNWMTFTLQRSMYHKQLNVLIKYLPFPSHRTPAASLQPRSVQMVTKMEHACAECGEAATCSLHQKRV